MSPTLQRALLALYAIGGIALGLVALAMMFGAFPSIAAKLPGHLVQELGAAAIMIGVMAAWAMRHLDRAGPILGFLAVFFALMAAIHVVEWLRGELPWTSAATNFVPLAGVAALLLARR